MSNDDIKVLDKHKKNITCDLCHKQVWFFQKVVRCVIRMKENVWAEYYHIKCLEKKGILRKLQKAKKGRWDKDDSAGTTNIVH